MASTTSFEGRNFGLQMGTNYGQITAEVHPPPERLETPPKPLSTVPFPRDQDFVDHGALLDQIHKKSSIPASRIALVGLGGVGKSQLAIEYSYRIRDQSQGGSQNTWVFWIHASNASRFEQSFQETADRIKIPGRKDPKANIFKLVYDWLQDERKGRWVLILDNVDNDQFLHEMPLIGQDISGHNNNYTTWQPLSTYLPLSPHGSIIITTRSRGVASRMVEERDVITIKPMDKENSQILFKKKLGGEQGNQDDIIELIAELEFMPLAIIQAAAYIKQRAPRSSVKQYLEEFRKNDHKKLSLLDHEGGQLRRDREAKNSIILTWQISFNYIRQIWPAAADLLSLMSFFDRQGIAECLLRDRSQSRDGIENLKESWEDKDRWKGNISNNKSITQSNTNDLFDDSILVLRNFSFISINTDGSSFEMHRLVQLATQKWLNTYGQLEQWKRQFIRNLSREFPFGKYENWEKCQLLFPHVQLAIVQRPDAKFSLLEWALLMNNAASFIWGKGDAIEVEKMAIKAMKLREKILGPEHESTLNSIGMVGLALDRQGRYKEAEAMHRRALAGQGKHKEAEAIHRRALAGYEKVLGVGHPHTLAGVDNLGLVLYGQGRYKEAEAMHRRALAGCEKVLGVNHPDTLTSINNLGGVLQRQGKYEEAEAMHRRALAAKETVLGVNHPDTLTSIDNLGQVLNSQGKYEEAEAMHWRALAAKETVLEVNHPDTLASINNLGLVLDSQGKYEEAEAMHRRALAGSERVLGVDHPHTLISMWNLSHTLKQQGQDVEALELLQTCVRLQHQKFGPYHPDTLSATAVLNNWQVDGHNHPHSPSPSHILPIRSQRKEPLLREPKYRKRDIIARLFQKQ